MLSRQKLKGHTAGVKDSYKWDIGEAKQKNCPFGILRRQHTTVLSNERHPSYTEMRASATNLSYTKMQEVITWIAQQYPTWYEESYELPPGILYRTNIEDFKSHLEVVRKPDPSTTNYYLSALTKLNEFRIEAEYQTELVVSRADYTKTQMPTANPWDG